MITVTAGQGRAARHVAALGTVLVLCAVIAQPEPAAAASAPVAVSAGWKHSCALRLDGTVSCWGTNGYGQLGDGTISYSQSLTPVSVIGISDATQITAGDMHSCALRAGGTISCWGYNVNGQLGDGTTSEYSPTPVSVIGISDATQITGNDYHSCALRSGGTISCWGYNYYGQLGDGTTIENPLKPVNVTGISDATQIAAGWGHSCALRSGGTISCWGINRAGQLGNGTTTDSLTPVSVTGISDATQISARGWQSCALRGGGTISCWGRNQSGQLGNGTTTNSSTPVSVTGISDATQITAGAMHSCASRGGSTISCWGRNFYGQLGNGMTTESSTPVSVTGISDAGLIAVGVEHSCALRSGGTISCWGSNVFGQLGNWPTTNSPTPVSVTGFPTLAQYAFEGFLAPVDNQPVLNTVSAGRAIQVKFRLGGDYGLGVLADGYPHVRSLDCSGAPLDEIEWTVPASASGLQYDAPSGTYTYVWKTNKTWTDSCRRLVLSLDDGIRHEADFKFR